MTKFRHLNILKIDHNPIEWPPKSIMEAPNGSDGGSAMKEWIRNMQRWMEENGSRPEGQRGGDDSFAGEQDSRDYMYAPPFYTTRLVLMSSVPMQ
jgi:hypothetical protein